VCRVRVMILNVRPGRGSCGRANCSFMGNIKMIEKAGHKNGRLLKD
jgi:hypothetical protein